MKQGRVGIIAPHLDELAVPIASLAPDPANARVHGPVSLDAIAASLRRFGQQKPIVIDASGVVIAGNGVLEAARRLGWTHVAAARSLLNGVDRAAYAIADNRVGELSTWDEAALRELLAALPPDAAAVAGWSPGDLERLLRPDEEGPVAEDDPVAPLPAAVTRHGDLWELGEHRLLCGDSTDGADVDRLMGADRAALVATDPPYLVDYTGVRAGDRGKDWSATYREIDIKDAGEFYESVFTHTVRVMAPHAAIYCWHAHKRIAEILEAWRGLDILDHQQIVWIKPAPVFGSVFWHFRHEPCLMGWLQGQKPAHDGLHEHGSVWLADGADLPIERMTRAQLVRLLKDASDAWEVDWEGRARPVGNEHPTQKPVELFARPMRKHTRRGDVCYEPFSGSGSQIVAAERLGRRCRAMELEPVFVDVAVRRWQALTGRAARLAGDGGTWAEVAAARGVPTEVPCRPDPNTPAPAPGATPSPTAATAPPTPASTPPRSRRRGAPPSSRRPAGATAPPGAGSAR